MFLGTIFCPYRLPAPPFGQPASDQDIIPCRISPLKQVPNARLLEGAAPWLAPAAFRPARPQSDARLNSHPPFPASPVCPTKCALVFTPAHPFSPTPCFSGLIFQDSPSPSWPPGWRRGFGPAPGLSEGPRPLRVMLHIGRGGLDGLATAFPPGIPFQVALINARQGPPPASSPPLMPQGGLRRPGPARRPGGGTGCEFKFTHRSLPSNSPD
jgi:hypothetical protein